MSALESLFQRPINEADLQQRFQQLMARQPSLRRRDIAKELEVSEAALIDQQCGVRSLRLRAEFKEFNERLPELGYIMTLTRNDYAVHERKGVYSNVKIHGPMGLVITDDRKIDLRLFLGRWKHAFAVMEDTPRGARFSLQVFDGTGQAIQKIFLQDDSDVEAYRSLVSDFAVQDQQGCLLFSVESKSADEPGDLPDQAGFVQEWREMTNVHQLFGMLRRYNLCREQAFELIGEEWAQAFDGAQVESILQQAAQNELPIMCFVGNEGLVQIHSGPIKTIKRMGPWLNILDPEFNLHLLEAGVARCWLVRKPTEDGIVTSLELYDNTGNTIAQFFGVREEGSPENAQWRELAESVLNEQAVA